MFCTVQTHIGRMCLQRRLFRQRSVLTFDTSGKSYISPVIRGVNEE
jgi:hypothetical protein